MYPDEQVEGVRPHGVVSRNARCLFGLETWTERGPVKTKYVLVVMDKRDRVKLANLCMDIEADVPLIARDKDWIVYLDPRTNALLCHWPHMEDSIGKWVEIYYPI